LINEQGRPSAPESLSVVVPFYNEAGNALALIEEIHAGLADVNMAWELVAVNDGSRDGTAAELDAAREKFGEHVTVVHFARNFGQTAAMQTGIDRARGTLIVTMDGDRQNDPADIPRLVAHMLENDLDMVSGWRKDRQDAAIKRKLPSRIANQIIRRVTGVEVKDNGCSLKVFRAHVIKQVVLMGEMHRFTSAWVASVTDPARIGEMAVNHRARTVGDSKYGLSRTTRVILDLLVVLFYMRFSRRPGHFFGSIGLGLGAVGGLILSYLFVIKVFLGEDIGGRPLLFVGILLAIAGVQLVTTGVLAEILTRNAPTRAYPVRAETDDSHRAWQH
jgi:glycosyltransferase involved in cell wall biosynthesis